MRTCTLVAFLCASLALHAHTFVDAQPVAVRHSEGIVHGFLLLRELDGTILANGDLIQTAQGDRVTTRLVFRFKDGSVHDDTAVFSQRGRFRLISDHLVQRGPSFPQQLDMKIDSGKGLVTINYTDDGEKKVASEQLELKPDLANGLIPTLLKNVAGGAGEITASMVAATPKPALVKLGITREGEDSFTIAGAPRKATRYVVKVDLGGLKSLMAKLLDKKPPDSRVWILQGDAPAFVRSEQPLYVGGPVWRIELTSPDWPKSSS